MLTGDGTVIMNEVLWTHSVSVPAIIQLYPVPFLLMIDNGAPICLAGLPMLNWGFNKNRYLIKWRCPNYKIRVNVLGTRNALPVTSDVLFIQNLIGIYVFLLLRHMARKPKKLLMLTEPLLSALLRESLLITKLNLPEHELKSASSGKPFLPLSINIWMPRLRLSNPTYSFKLA